MFPVMSKASSSLCHLKRCISAKKNLQQQQQQERGVATHVLLAQRQATQLLKSAPYIRSNALKYGKSRDLLDVFRAYQAEDETSVNTSLELLQFVTNELHSKYAIRKKTERYSRARFIYHPLFWRPLLQNWKNAIIKHRNVPHPFKLRDFLYQIAMKLPGFDCSEGLLAILSVLEQQQQQQSFVSTAVLSTQILEDFLQFSTTINNRPKPPHVSVFHQVLLAWSRVPTTNHDPNAIRMKLQKFQHVVTLMEKHHIRPNAAIYNIFLQFYGEQKNDQRDAFRRKLDELMQNNVRPDHDTIQLVRTTLEKDDPWKQKFLYYIAVTQDPDDDDDHDEEEPPNDDHKEETGDEEQEVEIIEKLQCDDVKDGNDDSVLHPKNSTAISSSHASKTLSSEEIPQQLADSKATEESEHLYNDDNSCRSSSLYPHDHENKNAWTISTHLVESLRTAVGNDREIARQLVDAAQIDWNRRIAQKEIHYQFNDEYCQIMTDVYTLAIEHVYGDELQQILERDPPSCAILMKAYARLGDYDSAHEILFRLITYEKLTNNVIFNILVDIWAQSKSPHAFERAIQVINELENQGLKANRTTYHALLQIADCTSPNP